MNSSTVPNRHTTDSKESVWSKTQTTVWLALAAVVVVWGVWSIWGFSWRDLYADQWRIYGKLLLVGFPQGLWLADNAHPSALPNLVRFYSLYAQRLNLELQVVLGLLFTLAALISAVCLIWRDRTLCRLQRSMAVFWVCVAIYWLANARMLMHPHESIHTYSLVWMLMLVGVGLVSGARASTSRHWPWWVCGVAAVIATFCFGPGLVVPTASIMVALLLRLPWPKLGFLLCGFLVSIALFFLVLTGSEHVPQLLVLRGWRNIEIMGQWLSTPITQCFFPFLDPNLAHWVPYPLSRFSAHTANLYFAHQGNIWRNTWPQAGVGLSGMIVVLITSFRIWYNRRPLGDTQLLGLLLAWFGLGVAALISLSRLEVFEQYPDQVYANRYLPWSCLFWCGLVLLFVGQQEIGRKKKYAWQATGLLMFAVVMVFNPVFIGWSRAVHALIQVHAMAVLLDQYTPTLPQGETQPLEVKQALPSLRENRLAMFAWPSANWVGRAIPTVTMIGQTPQIVTARRIAGSEHALGYTGMVTVPPGPWPGRPEYWIVLDARQYVIGLARSFAKYGPRDLQMVLQDVSLQQELTLVPFLGIQPATEGFRLQVNVEPGMP
jgi:hypothetical protein